LRNAEDMHLYSGPLISFVWCLSFVDHWLTGLCQGSYFQLAVGMRLSGHCWCGEVAVIGRLK